MKQIFFLTGSMYRGGAERVISILSKHYAERGWGVKILTLLHNRVEYVLDPRVDVVDFSNDSINASFDTPRLIFKLRSFVRKNKPDVVVAFMAPICFIAGFACSGLKTRLILSERNDPELQPRNAIMKMALKKLYAKSHKTVMQTERAKNYFPDNVRKNSVIIPNPVQVGKYASEQKSARIVAVGRLESQKNFAMLIDAFSMICQKHPEYKLDIYGEGTLRDALQKQIDSMGLADKATLKGNVLDVHEKISDAEIFVLSSNFEGLSNALLEAMMMGLACISTSCAGSDEVIRDGENGLLIPVGDRDALAVALERLIEDSSLRKKIEKSAAAEAKRFEVCNVVKMWEQAIEG